MASAVNSITKPATIPSREAPTEFGSGAIVEPLGAITFYAAAALRWLEREQPDVDEAIAGLSRIMEKTREMAALVRPDVEIGPIDF